MNNTWQPITPESPIKEGDIIGGYNPTGRWLQVRVTSYMVKMKYLTIGRMIPTHWTKEAAFWDMPRRPKVEDCKVMELTF
jgi:hypothetical protein